jgi:flagellar biosynthesis chaperone FliJ
MTKRFHWPLSPLLRKRQAEEELAMHEMGRVAAARSSVVAQIALETDNLHMAEQERSLNLVAVSFSGTRLASSTKEIAQIRSRIAHLEAQERSVSEELRITAARLESAAMRRQALEEWRERARREHMNRTYQQEQDEHDEATTIRSRPSQSNLLSRR